MQEQFYTSLKHFWGFSDFRPLQKEIILSLMEGKDTLALLPTGGGKSLCYQLPAVLSEGTALVISPLLALMKDQVNDLNFKGIPAAYMSSEWDEDQEDQLYENLKNEDYKLLYISPERLLNRKFLENIPYIKISFLAVDEAHCISEWGNDFRPSYQNIRYFRQQYEQLPCLALTATASLKVMQEIQAKLGFKQSQIFRKSYKRNNLFIQTREIVDKYEHIYYYLKNNKKPGLIYVRTRKEAEDLSQWLQNKGLQNINYYHAGLSSEEKQKRQNYWLNHNHYTLVSTNAFGMGIDKENVAFVIHLSPPPSIENYYQEIGRAGRNGENAETILLWYKSELNKIDDLYKSQLANKSEYKKIISFVHAKCQVAEGEQPENFHEINTYNIQKATKIGRSKIISVLRFLHNQEIIYLKESQSASSLKLNFNIREVESLGKNDGYFIELLSRVLGGIDTHRVYFREKNLVEKLQIDEATIKMKLKELHRKQHLDYFDGSSLGIRFLTPRNDLELENKYWKTFSVIQKNKLQKWEEMKYFLQENSICKMKMILAYFGEKEKGNCGKCNYCLSKNLKTDAATYNKMIFEALMKSPLTLDEMSVQLKFYPKEEILDHLKQLLDSKRIKMLDYKTYTL